MLAEKDFIGTEIRVGADMRIVRNMNPRFVHLGTAKLSNEELRRFINICVQIDELSDPKLLLPLYAKRYFSQEGMDQAEVWQELAVELISAQVDQRGTAHFEEMLTQARLGTGSVSLAIKDFFNETRPIEDFKFEKETQSRQLPLEVKTAKFICPLSGLAKKWYETAIQVIRMAEKQEPLSVQSDII